MSLGPSVKCLGHQLPLLHGAPPPEVILLHPVCHQREGRARCPGGMHGTDQATTQLVRKRRAGRSQPLRLRPEDVAMLSPLLPHKGPPPTQPAMQHSRSRCPGEREGRGRHRHNGEGTGQPGPKLSGGLQDPALHLSSCWRLPLSVNHLKQPWKGLPSLCSVPGGSRLAASGTSATGTPSRSNSKGQKLPGRREQSRLLWACFQETASVAETQRCEDPTQHVNQQRERPVLAA